jgi:L-ascorbate metabolism protein UlaG (beta-lactamase superfamily)
MGKLIFHGHACTEIVCGDGTRILIDPFLTDNPKADVGPEHFHDRLDYVLLTHGHFDHVADAWGILEKTGATLVGTFELVSYAGEKKGHEKGHPMNVGGAHDFPFGRVKLVPALHTGKVDGEDAEGYTTTAHGYLLEIDGTRIYHAGDTALIKDMELLAGHVDVALLPIGDNFTMGPEDAARAAQMVQPRVVIPIHYDTWPPIEQDPDDFRELVEPRAEVVVLQPGESWDF